MTNQTQYALEVDGETVIQGTAEELCWSLWLNDCWEEGDAALDPSDSYYEPPEHPPGTLVCHMGDNLNRSDWGTPIPPLQDGKYDWSSLLSELCDGNHARSVVRWDYREVS